ncbi:hypothetical protein G7Y89_g1327 [Cudoniella acicularis]|uniref:Uncharacterized protein n=1 Tax=Cudoniella acicularis TaxID=354080 RepID=A0A8H4WAF0_9HELO|nr:hypothetical protein G7Y89_g1327 [Cudoniella acicularis]
MSTPVFLDEFNSIFPSWPDDSLSRRIDRIPAGSSWDVRELGTFQILRSPLAKETPPTWLQSHFVEASARVRESVPMQSVLQLFRQDWRNKTHEDLTQAAGPLASFVTLLSQVLETAIVSDPRRELRGQEIHAHALPSTGLSSSPSMPSSPPEFPNKRFRKDRSSSSYWPSDESDQSSHDQRAKSEATTNACIYELLRCVTEISRNKNDSPFRLEWTITQDTVTVHAGSHEYCTTNDGNFVHKAHRMGCWQRASNYSYCSIEAKSWHNTLEKPRTVKAQEAAHLVAMFSQHIRAEEELQHDLVVPLVSGAQNLFSLVLGNFPKEYEQYLHDGSQLEQMAFPKVEEYGMFKMQDSDELRIVFTIIVALNLKLQSLGPMG